MPTARTYAFIIISLMLYFFANQTQIGWLYVMSTLLLAVLPVAFIFNRRTLRGLAATRTLSTGADAELYEGDPLSIHLTLHNRRLLTAVQLRTTERCPLAPPAERARHIFVPSLPGAGAVTLDYEVLAWQRGLHEFPPLDIETRAPFGFWRHRRTLAAPTRALVYPELRPLRRLPLLDRRMTPEITQTRAGIGSEVIGVRPFRSGDSPRHIHWRTVARTGRLATKEFADETQPGLTLALDLFAHAYAPTADKHTPFEWAIKAAASIGDYALTQGYPLHLLADDKDRPLPGGAITRDALWQYLARVQPDGAQPFTDVLLSRTPHTYTAILLPWPDMDVIGPLLGLQAQGLRIMAVVLDPASFPDGGPDGRPLAGALAAAGISEVRLLRFGDDWPAVLMGGQPEHKSVA